MIRRPPRSTRTDTLFPYTTLFRSLEGNLLALVQPTQPGALDGRDVHEHVRPAAVRLDEPVTLGAVEPLHGSDRHCRSEEHTSELQSLMRISYAVFCLKKKNNPSLTPSPSINPITTMYNNITH